MFTKVMLEKSSCLIYFSIHTQESFFTRLLGLKIVGYDPFIAARKFSSTTLFVHIHLLRGDWGICGHARSEVLITLLQESSPRQQMTESQDTKHSGDR